MIYINLLIGFLKVGLFSFGGAYAAIPMIRDIVLEYGWMDEDALMNMVAISESTPGPIMVNLATYVGCSRAGILGGILTTIAVVVPAFTIIILAIIFMEKAPKNKYVSAVFHGMAPSIIGIILATGLYMLLKISIRPLMNDTADIRPVVMTALLLTVFYGSRKLLKKKMSPILLILLSAVMGVIVYGV